MNARSAALVGTLAFGLVAGAADSPVAAEWPSIDALTPVDLLTPEKLKEQLVIDLETGAGSENCPSSAWTGRATFLYPDGEELTYFGTGIYCAPIGYGRIQYSDGRVYVGEVSSFLASASAVLTEQQFKPAVRHGNGKLQSKRGTPLLGHFERGHFVGDRAGDSGFIQALDAAEASLPDRHAPLMTQAVAAFAALPAGGSAVSASVNPFSSAPVAGDSIADAGAAAIATKSAMQAPVAEAAGAFSAPMAAGGGGAALSAVGAATAGVMASNSSGGGVLALPAPLPENFRDQAGMFGFPNLDADAAATAKQLTKEFELSSRDNGVFFGASCPKAGFLGLKPWRARVVYTKTFSGRIVYDGVGLGCGAAGPGRVEFEDGSVYEGQTSTFMGSTAFPLSNFEPAVPSGAGRFTFPDGTSVEGTWVRGELNGGPVIITKPGQQPQALVSGTLASLRAGGMVGQASAASLAGAAAQGATSQGSVGAIAAPAATGSSMGALMVPAADAAAAAMSAGGSPLPFTPAGSTGLPFTPAGAAGAVGAVAGGAGKAGPQPMLGNTGKYLCPYTEDGVVAQWVDKAIKARMGGAIGGMVGAEVGKELFKNIPMFGGMFGKAAGDKMGREVAIKMAGGWEFMRANTDQSFENVNDYVVWLRLNYKGTEHYNSVVAAIKELYPELKTMQF
jgi:hypothetical protein